MISYQDASIIDLTKLFFLALVSFVTSFALTPVLTHLLYKYRLGKHVRQDGSTPVFSALHKDKEGTPTMGGVLIWVTTALLAVVFYAIARFTTDPFWKHLNFLTRKETWLPLAMLVAAGVVGLADDVLNIYKKRSKAGGFGVKERLLMYGVLAAAGAWWFYYKLGWDVLHVPGVGNFTIGWLYIPLFILVIIATAFSANEIDGLDGLSGGTLLAAFAAYGGIALFTDRIDLAAFCGVIMGALFSFLWFNIHPARFFMGDTGVMSLGATLGIIAMLTNSTLVLPIIAMPLVITSLSVIVQVVSKKVFKKKVLLSAPLHHHLQAIGWPETKIVMRFWIIAAVFAGVGMVIGIIGQG